MQEIENENLIQITALAHRQIDLERSLAELETHQTDLKERHRRLSEELIPEAMMAVGLVSFKLADGTRVDVDKFYAGSIKAEHKLAAFQWLRDHGHDSLIKRVVGLTFGRGEDDEANKFKQAIAAMGYIPEDKQDVHAMTLKAFIREQMEAGKEFPAELFGAFVGNRTKLTTP